MSRLTGRELGASFDLFSELSDVPRALLARVRRERTEGAAMGRFDEMYRRSLDHPEDFWAEAAAEIDWNERWEQVLDDSLAPFYRWFAGGRLNSCHNALDRHVAGGRGDQLALIYDSPVTATTAAFTYRELRDAVARFAGALAA
jgi:propionyl-CoA synthetase